FLGRAGPAVEQHGTDQRLDGIREDRHLSVVARLAAAQNELLVEPELAAQRGQGGSAHERRPLPTQLALAGGRITQIEGARDREIEECVAEKLEPLVVRAG